MWDIAATGAVTYLERRLDRKQGLDLHHNINTSPNTEELRRKQLLDAYGDRESLERLAEVTAVYEATR